MRQKSQKWFLTSLALVVTTLVLAQTQSVVVNGTTNDKVKTEEFKALLNREFTKIVTGKSFSNLGNFASVSSDAKTLTVGGNLIKKESVLGFELSGGATEGILKLINNEELNSNFGIDIKYHKLIKMDYAERDALAVSNIEKELTDLKEQFSGDSISIVEKQELYKISDDLFKARFNIDKSSKTISKIDSKLKLAGISDNLKDSLNIAKGLLTYEIAKIKNDTIVLNNRLSKISKDEETYFLDQLEKKAEIRDAKWIEIDEKKKNLPLKAFDVTWISFGLKANKNTFKLFQESNTSGHQFMDTSFVSQRFTASISRYRNTAYQSQDVYWSAGLFIDYTTTFDDLSKVVIENRRPITGDSQKEEVKTLNVYKGDYREGIIKLTIFYDYYCFFGKYNTTLGLHLNPSYTICKTNKRPITNLYAGLIIPFEDKEKQASKINVEIFLSVQDVFSYLDKARSNVFGIRATLPVNLINNKL
jgi:hypothetical protein